MFVTIRKQLMLSLSLFTFPFDFGEILTFSVETLHLPWTSCHKAEVPKLWLCAHSQLSSLFQ